MIQSSKPGLLVLTALALAACSARPSAPAAPEPPLEGARIGGDFTLTGENGEAVSAHDFDGEYRIMYFGYTSCPDVCPVDLANIGQGLKVFEKEDPPRAGKVVPIFVTVDPERDTPAVMKQYTDNFHPRMVGLTGTPEQIARVAKEYLVVYGKREDAGYSEYLVDHTRQTILFGPKGEPLAILPSEEGPEPVAKELARWVK